MPAGCGEAPSDEGKAMRREPRNKRHESKQSYGTPPEFLEAVRARFGELTVDLASSHDNAVCADHLTEEDDSLSADWVAAIGSGIGWLNPPFGGISRWVAKCAATAPNLAGRILVLVPASVGANWFAGHVWGRARVYACNGRITFVGCSQPFPKDCVVLEYGGLPGFEVWDWRGKKSISGDLNRLLPHG